MSKKRFTMDNESDIIEFDYNTNEYIQDFMFADGKGWDRICNRLNELFDENEQLKKENRNLRFEMSMYEQKIEELEKELNVND